MRRLVLRLAFAERIPYRRGEGFSNAKFALPFNILKEISMGKNEMARLVADSSNELFDTLADWSALLEHRKSYDLPVPLCP